MKNEEFVWADSLEDTIKSFRIYVINQADERMQWYHRWFWIYKGAINLIKIIVILLFAFGTLLPLIVSIKPEIGKYLPWGYFCLTSGSLILLFDKFFGLSTRLTSFYITFIDIRTLKHSFVVDWEAIIINEEKPISFKSVDKLLEISKMFLQKVNELVRDETTGWTIDFQTRSNEFAKFINAQKTTKGPS